jgi:hypothetical protein
LLVVLLLLFRCEAYPACSILDLLCFMDCAAAVFVGAVWIDASGLDAELCCDDKNDDDDAACGTPKTNKQYIKTNKKCGPAKR